jgi:hypothetical protein
LLRRYTGGQYTITLQNGADGTPIIDECGQITPPGSFLNFNIADTVTASFNYQHGCDFDTLVFNQDGNNGINQWNWNFEGIAGSSVQNRKPFIRNSVENIQLMVQRNFSVAQHPSSILTMNSGYFNPTLLCPEDKAF